MARRNLRRSVQWLWLEVDCVVVSQAAFKRAAKASLAPAKDGDRVRLTPVAPLQKPEEEEHMAIRRPESFRHREASLPGIKIHYVREGSGPPLLLMHGWPGFWYEWYSVAP